MTVVVLIGSFPPPVHGAALATISMAEHLAGMADVVRADVSPDGLIKGAGYHAQVLA